MEDDLYLDLMEFALTRAIFGPPYQLAGPPAGLRKVLFRLIRGLLPAEYEIVRRATVQDRDSGHIWPVDAETMIGLKRLRNIRECVDLVLRDGVPGDFLEAGVWRGGGAIYMRACLKARNVSDRRVWAADSFQGLPASSDPRDTIDWDKFRQLAVSRFQVEANFARYRLLDEQVSFVEGFFDKTLPGPIERLAIMRVDADMYQSTMDVLRALYSKVSRGGFVIIDDYGSIDACRAAVDEFRTANAITSPLLWIDGTGVFWRVTSP